MHNTNTSVYLEKKQKNKKHVLMMHDPLGKAATSH